MTEHPAVYDCGGWYIEEHPNAYAEDWRYHAMAFDGNGMLLDLRNFRTWREASDFCHNHERPIERQGRNA